MSDVAELALARVPLLDPITGRLDDQYAPPSVAANTLIAVDAKNEAVVKAGAAGTSAAAAKSSEDAAKGFAKNSEDSSVSSDGFRALSATAAGQASGAEVNAKAYRDEAKTIRDSINADRGVANGLATLDGSGRIPASMLPTSALQYKGGWNASTNTPALSNATGTLGFMYRVTAAALRDLGSGNLDFQIGDNLIHNGTVWEKIDNTDQVSSVAGKFGAVTLVKGDVGLGNVDNTSDANKPVSTAVQTELNKTYTGAAVVGDNLILTKLGGGQTDAGNVRGPQGLMGEQIPQTVNSAANGTLDLSNALLPRVYNFTLTGNITSIILPPQQAYSYVLCINFKQDATGGRTIALPSGLKFPGGFKPTFSTAPNVLDQLYIEMTGTDYLGKVGGFAFA